MYKKSFASTIFTDTFSGGASTIFWHFTRATPIPSSFGIQDNNLGVPNGLFNLVTNSTEPSDNIEKIEANVTTIPSLLLFACRGNSNNQDFVDAIFNNDGTTNITFFISGGGNQLPGPNWDTTPGIHSFETDCVGDTVTMKEDENIIFSNTVPLTFISEANQFVEIIIQMV